MPIIKGSTPTIRIVLSTEEVDVENLYQVYITFAQNGTNVLPQSAIEASSGTVIGDTIVFSIKLTQTDTNSLKEDVDLNCQVDVLINDGLGGYDRKISKVFSFGVCKSLRSGVLPPSE